MSVVINWRGDLGGEKGGGEWECGEDGGGEGGCGEDGDLGVSYFPGFPHPILERNCMVGDHLCLDY